jgi:hypothetical protein
MPLENVTDSANQKQLPKPILFLRKQKQTSDNQKADLKILSQKGSGESV